MWAVFLHFLSQRLNLDGTAFGHEAHLGTLVVLGVGNTDVACTLPNLDATVEAGLPEVTIIPNHHSTMIEAV
jgi:hypothetical protein